MFHTNTTFTDQLTKIGRIFCAGEKLKLTTFRRLD